MAKFTIDSLGEMAQREFLSLGAKLDKGFSRNEALHKLTIEMLNGIQEDLRATRIAVTDITDLRKRVERLERSAGAQR